MTARTRAVTVALAVASLCSCAESVRLVTRHDAGADAADACPDASVEPRRVYACDPFDPRACASSESCYPYVERGACGAAVFRARCAEVGRLPLGSPCTAGNDCARGASCFVVRGAARCMRLCRVGGGAPRCPEGQRCAQADLADFGACE